MSASPATVEELLRSARRRLVSAGSEGAAIDARVLVGGILGLDLSGLVMAGNDPVDARVVAAVDEAIARRIAGTPPGRILGRREFHGLVFELGPETLEPRPDTEVLVDAAVAAVRRGAVPGAAPDGDGLVFADLGTGTGAIAVAVAVALPMARGVAVDLAPGAVAVARRNAGVHGVSDRLTVVEGSWLEGIDGPFGLILSNPPYIETADLGGLDREVREHDPRLALDGGEDGLAAYRAIVAAVPARLGVGGTLMVEIGWRQAGDVGALFRGAGFGEVACLPDLAGRDRVVTGRRMR